jgi:type II secretion system protein C
MELLLRRQGWAANLIGIAIGTALGGHATATLIGAALPSPTSSGSQRRGGTAAAAVAPTDRSSDVIIGRNVFCSQCGETLIPEPTRPALTLLAIMFARSDPRWSLAIVRDDETSTTGPYAVGARLGGATVEAIEDVRVVLDLGRGRRERLELLAPEARLSSGRGPAEPITDGIRKTGPNSYELRRAVIDRVLAGGLARLLRVAPQPRDGEPTGLRLLDVGRDGPFGAIGLRDGDVLLQVNGRSLATPDAALAAYSALRKEDHLWLAIERAGQRLRLDYVIR